MPTEDEIRQCVLLARGMQEDEDKAHIPPDRSRALNACGHRGREEVGGTLTLQRAPTPQSQGPEVDPRKRQRAPQARGHGNETVGGDPPTSSNRKLNTFR